MHGRVSLPGAACARCRGFVSNARDTSPGAAMTVVLDTATRPRHPEKAHRPDTPVRKKPDWIRVKAPVSKGYAADARHRARARPAHGLRGGRLPQYRRVLGEEARDLHDHGRHLHARLRVLQRQDRAAGRARPRRARAGRRGDRKARPRACRGHLGRPRRSCRRRRRALRADDPRHPRALPGDHDRGAHARISCARTARSRPWSRRGPTCSTTISRPCRRTISRCGRARAISPRSGCCSG